MTTSTDNDEGRAPIRKSPDAFRTISEVSDDLNVPQHVLRFWESKFTQIRPLKRGGRRRYYRPEDVLLLRGIRRLLYDDGYTIKGVQKVLKERGVRSVADGGREPSDEAVTPSYTDERPAEEAIVAVAAAGTEPLADDGPDRAELERLLDELGTIRSLLVQ
ncbi:MerR family transcriptional regulator [Iodidimonas sp. SYSU 1G8]|uniref:MerR family transcriptional regulator n=1 Tax=Iodidimonas sp. SYSU 1G8 TaxID=3133967 RepID=UPI0031FEAF32